MTPETDYELPEGWRWAKLGEMCEVVTGTTPPRGEPRFYGGSIPWVKPEDLGDSVSVGTSAEGLTEQGLLAARLLPAGSVLVTCIGNIGKCGVAAKPLTTNQQINSLIPGDRVDSLFLYYTCTLRRDYLRKIASTALLPILNKSTFAAIPVPLPPLPEQRRIAAILTEQMAAVDRARAAAEAQLQAAQALPAAYLREVFESEEARSWPRLTLGQVACVQSGYAFRSEWFTPEGIRLLRNANVHQGYVAWHDTARLPECRRREFAEYELLEGDIVLSLDRPFVADGLKVARLGAGDVPSLLLQRVARLCLDPNVNPQFVYAFLRSDAFVAATRGHDQSLGVPHISPLQVGAVELPLPPVQVQARVCALLADEAALVTSAREALEAQLATVHALPAALLRQAFSGGL